MITFKNTSKTYIIHNIFFSNMIKIKKFNPNLLSIDKISYKNYDAVVYSIKYLMMESINNQKIDSENPLSLSFSDVDGYIIEESNETKYFIFALTKRNKTSLRNIQKTLE